MHFLQDLKEYDFVLFDKLPKVGGMAWWLTANRTSKLQTEVGSYHLEYHMDNPLPTDFNNPWPSADILLNHFMRVSEEYGIIPYCRMNTHVKIVEEIPCNKETAQRRGLTPGAFFAHYELKVERLDGQQKGEHFDFNADGVAFYPGNLSLPRKETYKGEDQFGGQIEYGMYGSTSYKETYKGEDQFGGQIE